MTNLLPPETAVLALLERISTAALATAAETRAMRREAAAGHAEIVAHMIAAKPALDAYAAHLKTLQARETDAIASAAKDRSALIAAATGPRGRWLIGVAIGSAVTWLVLHGYLPAPEAPHVP